jgi:alpha-1,2-mannosyltransferase
MPKSALHWLSPGRVRAYSATILLVSLIYALPCAWVAWKMFHQPGGFDFVTFWSASRLSLDGTPLAAYSYASIQHVAQGISPHFKVTGPWFYPPNFLLVVRPFALLPCWLAFSSFAIVTTAVFVVLLRKAVPLSGALLPVVAFPGLMVNALQGQNACLTASLVLGAILLLPKRPILAGVCIGMMSIKPHLAILFPLALACAGMWSTFIAAAVTAILFTGASIAVFGTAVIPAFLHAMSEANADLASGMLPWSEMASAFAALRVLHVAAPLAYAAQACEAIVAMLALGWVWRNSRELEVRATALVAGTFMVSPYVYIYDTVWLGIPIALLTAKAVRDGWLRWEREILCIAWLFPVAGEMSGYFLHAGIGPLVFALLMFVALRRVRLYPKGLAQGQAGGLPTPPYSPDAIGR